MNGSASLLPRGRRSAVSGSDSAPSPAGSLPRVCMLLESFYPVVGGMETQARNLAASLAALGVPVRFLTRRARREWPRRDTVDGFPVVRVGPVGRVPATRWLLVLTCLPALIRWRRHYDVILVPGFRTLGIAAVLAGRWLDKVTVLKAESCGEMSGEFFAGGLQRFGLTPRSFGVRHLLRWRNRWLTHADAIVSLSADMTEEYRRAGVPPERVRVIPQSVDAERFQPANAEEKRMLRARLGLPATPLTVIFTGRLVSYKGLPALLRVWQRLIAERRDLHLVVCGAGGTDLYNWEQELKAFVQANELTACVTLPGAVRNVEDYLRAADLYAFPTENEAFPLALLEAMACGLPAVATTVGGIPDVIRHEENGLLIRPGDESALHDAMSRLLSDAALRARLGERAAATVRERYTREQVSREYVALFERCLASRRPRAGREPESHGPRQSGAGSAAL